MNAPRLETERLILRPPHANDLDAWAACYADAETMRFMGGTMGRSPTWRAMCSIAGAWTLFGFGMFSVVEKETGRWVGRLGPWAPADWPGNEIGWTIVRDAWGKGYATEGATAAMDFAFETLGWTEVIHCIDPRNAASQAVAGRLGSALLRKGRMPPPYDAEEVDIWGQDREGWRARRR